MAKKKKKKQLSQYMRQPPRFLVMSKLIGIVIAIILIIIIGYSMWEMHLQHDLSSLPQLIISVFALGSVYIGFYLTMAKWEHVEIEKTNRFKEVLKLKKVLGFISEKEVIEEEIEDLDNKIQDLENKETELENEEIHDTTIY